ncbi:thymidylate synthase [Aeromonas phage 4L372D]|uniref:Thymidylate synthase n=3 Tax=Plateaulakevirus TaxID=2843436 RepID=A0A5B9NCT7_9CAUD|nr:thymidylate synthase [Aeromonas phage 2L372D]YP_009846519.1 thymidylate synthase [Aeromonas phage 2L372X]YP_009846747.1 thymidylate synthase [Aeromonas phage 4L372D]QDB74095.1 thymidylate synthase [Aeromonas phage 2L372D]QEG08434.1 thymidylate synthase [Aeromonas phage 2L372X]QEG08663.1 thymidylate synthase [Aeromonas phage 4L372D]
MKGISIKLVDHMGDDFRVFEAAKATLGGSEESQFKRGETDPTRLINFLAREKHVTPFRHPQVTFECEAPIAIARQLGKHQSGFSWNERSMRYKDSVIDIFVPDMFRGRPDKLHDGSTEVDVSEKYAWETYNTYEDDYTNITVAETYNLAVEQSVTFYEALVEAGLAPEQARFILPQGMITRWVWTGSLYGWYSVYKQRSSEHAQYEVREFARQLDDHMSKLFPIAWQALKDSDNIK